MRGGWGGAVREKFISSSEMSSICGVFLRTCFYRVLSLFFLTFSTEFCFFILGSERLPEQQEETTPEIRSRLIQRCDHLSEEVDIDFKIELQLYIITVQISLIYFTHIFFSDTSSGESRFVNCLSLFFLIPNKFNSVSSELTK